MSLKLNIIVIIGFINIGLYAQNETLAKQYFDEAQFEKASLIYKVLLDKQPQNLTYLDAYVQTLQAQEKFDEVNEVLSQYLTRKDQSIKASHQGFANVLMGYNFVLQQDSLNAKKHFDTAYNIVVKKTHYGYQIAKKFHDVQQLEYALKSYQLLIDKTKSANYRIQMATIYGEMGQTEAMFDTFLDLIATNKRHLNITKRYLVLYLTDDNLNENNVLLRHLLVKRIQDNPTLEWYRLLSWLFMMQKDYSKALIQEQAIFMNEFDDLKGVKDVGIIAFDDKHYDVAISAFEFILAQAHIPEDKIEAHYYLLESYKQTEQDKAEVAKRYTDFFEVFPPSHLNVNVQVSYADFLTFYQDKPDKGIDVLDQAMTLAHSKFDIANIKLQLGDILVYNGQYNRALILYTQVQNELKSHTIGQSARFKVAQTSYFKGDFEWANTQLKVLKRSTSKLIANDAIDLSILISTNTQEDIDSLNTALKQYAHADLLAYQNKTNQAIDTLSQIIKQYKDHPILDNTLYKEAKLQEQIGNYQKSIVLYEAILSFYQDDILHDDAIYHIAKLYDEQLFEPEKAKTYYEKIITDHPSSIHLIDARKRFRALRGDEAIP